MGDLVGPGFGSCRIEGRELNKTSVPQIHFRFGRGEASVAGDNRTPKHGTDQMRIN